MENVQVKIGFVPSYRFGFKDWCEKMRSESLDAFNKVEGLEIVTLDGSPDGEAPDAADGITPHGAVHTLDDAEAAAEYFLHQDVDGLILCPLDFGDERSAAKVAEKLQVPVLIYATKEPKVPDSPSLARTSDSYCGNLSMASALHRRGVPFHYAGLFFPEEEEFSEEIERFVRSVAVVKGLTGARIGHVGNRPATFETVAYDEIAMVNKFSQNVIHSDLAEIVINAEKLPDDDSQVQAVVDEIKKSVAEVTVGDKYLIAAAKLETALAEFWTKNKLSCMAMQCWPSIQKMMGISTCAVFGRLTGRDMLTACEADVLGAVAMRAVYDVALGHTLPHFIDWTIRHRDIPNRLLAWHCGNAPLCLAADPENTALRSRRDMKGELPIKQSDKMAGLLQFQLTPGEVTFCRLAEYKDEWRMLIASGEIIPGQETHAGTWAWVEVNDHDRLYRTLVEEGFIHHAAMIHGDWQRPLQHACKFLDIRPVIIE